MRQLRKGQLRRPAESTAPPLRRRQPCPRALADPVSLIFRHRRQQAENAPANRAFRVEILGQGAEGDALLVEIMSEQQRLEHGPAEAVELPHDQLITGSERL